MFELEPSRGYTRGDALLIVARAATVMDLSRRTITYNNSNENYQGEKNEGIKLIRYKQQHHIYGLPKGVNSYGLKYSELEPMENKFRVHRPLSSPMTIE